MNTKSFVILFFLIFAWLTPCKAQYDLNAVEKARMAKAGVKTQTQWTYNYVDGKPSAKGYISSVTKYDTRGNVVEEINYNEKGEIISVTIQQYDSRDNKVNYERYQDNRKKMLYSQKTVYDAKGNKTREYGYDGASMYSNTFQYDENGRLSEIRYTVENVLVERRQMKYSGSKTEISIFDPNNNLTFRQENTHNDKGMLVSEIKTGGKGNMVHSLDLQYNTSGALTEEVKKRADDKFEYQKLYQYDSENRPVREEMVNMDGTRFVSREFQYNSQGDLIMESWKKSEKAQDFSTKKIMYDSKGLCTEMECYFATYKLKSLYKFVYEFY